jgi:hypothetical protein
MTICSRFGSVLGLLAITWFSVGCNGPKSAPANPETARNALDTSLQAWKNGAKSESLQNQSPAVFFYYDSWEKGERLLDYKVSAPTPYGNSLKVKVKLVLETKAGKKHVEETDFSIDTHPKIVISCEPVF